MKAHPPPFAPVLGPLTSPQSYRRFEGPDTWDAIVIGSGIGGLTTAALLARSAGRRVLVLERHYTAGGFTHSFERPGFDWDVGVHYLGGMQPGAVVRTLFDHLTDGELAWADMGPVYDRVVIGTDRFDYPKGRKNLEAALKTAFPAEHRAIDGYFAAVKAATRASQSFFVEKALPAGLATVAGPWLRRRYLRYATRTTRAVLEELTGNQRLIAILTAQFGDYGLPPAESSFAIHAAVASHYFGGGYYPVGGAARIAATIMPAIERAGGAVLVSAAVDRIIVEGGRASGVRMADGREFRAPLVISAAGVATTIGRLLPDDVAAASGLKDRLTTVRPSLGHFSLYLGLGASAEALALPKTNYWIYPHDRPEAALADFVRDPEAPFPLVYLSFPAAKDPDFQRRHPGHSTIEAVTLAPWSWFGSWEGTRWMKRGDDYEALKSRIAARLQGVVEAYVPTIRGQVRHAELSTPLSTAHFAGYPQGEIYGLDHTPARFKARWLRPRTPIKGLFLTGQDISTCGVAGALLGGVLTASAILRRNLLGSVLRKRAVPA